jgi:hypothetical protein
MTGFAIDMDFERTFRSDHQRLVTVRSNLSPGLKPGMVRRATAKWARNRTKSDAIQPAESAEDLCRQARHLRAKFGADPVQMFQQLSRLSIVPDATTVVHPKPPPRHSTPISSNWTRTSSLGRSGMALLSKLGQGLSVGAGDENETTKLAIWDEDEGPRYTLVDPDYVPSEEESLAMPDQDFRTLVKMTLQRSPTVLRYTQRMALLKEAGQRGIGRFEANLVIASVEHELGRVGRQALTLNSRRPLWIGGIALFVVVQSAVAVGLWELLHS